MAMLRPYINYPGDGLYFPVIQSNPNTDMYKKGIIPDRIGSMYRARQKKFTNKNNYFDKISRPLQQPLGTPSAMSMMGSGKHVPSHQSKQLAFYNEVGMSVKRKPKVLKGTVGKLGSSSFAKEPTFNKKINRYVK